MMLLNEAQALLWESHLMRQLWSSGEGASTHDAAQQGPSSAVRTNFYLGGNLKVLGCGKACVMLRHTAKDQVDLEFQGPYKNNFAKGQLECSGWCRRA